MDSTLTSADLLAWINSLPYSHIVYPESTVNKIKYFFWRLYTPLHSPLRNTLMHLGILRHSTRQNFLLGKIAPDQTVQDFVSFLIERGYGNHFVAWRDKGELLSLRRLDGFECQYHLRVFEDGEVRGHYEYTPECYPLWHFRAVDQEDRRGEFLDLLGDKII